MAEPAIDGLVLRRSPPPEKNKDTGGKKRQESWARKPAVPIGYVLPLGWYPDGSPGSCPWPP
jgi:hypothetical protein